MSFSKTVPIFEEINFLVMCTLIFSIFTLIFDKMNIDFRSIAIFLYFEGAKPEEIKRRIDLVFGPDSYSYSAITKSIRMLSFGPIQDDNENVEEKLIHEEKMNCIKRTIEDFPFLSLKQIAVMTNIPKSTVQRILTQELHYVLKNLKWMPYDLTPSQKVKRIELSKELLNILREGQKTNYKFIITGDESWFYLSTDYQRQWLPVWQKPSKRVKKMIGAKKFMFTIFWNPHGFLLVKILPKSAKFNEDYFINEILEPINELTKNMRVKSEQKLILHYDNARPHTSQKVFDYLRSHNIEKAPHPPFSPDIAPSDFFLFGHVKFLLTGKSFRTEEDLFVAINEILMSIPKNFLMDAFSNWEKRLDAVISSKGNYLE